MGLTWENCASFLERHDGFGIIATFELNLLFLGKCNQRFKCHQSINQLQCKIISRFKISHLKVSDNFLGGSGGAFWVFHIEILFERFESLRLPFNTSQILPWDPILMVSKERYRWRGRRWKNIKGLFSRKEPPKNENCLIDASSHLYKRVCPSRVFVRGL